MANCTFCIITASLTEAQTEFHAAVASLARFDQECVTAIQRRHWHREDLAELRAKYFASFIDYVESKESDKIQTKINSLETRLNADKEEIRKTEGYATTAIKAVYGLRNKIYNIRKDLIKCKGCTCLVKSIIKGKPSRQPRF
ncbi:hypothetical protein CcaverHIS002_0411760 [Cutaneotrichosporon cavernicola]|nr:hypothetical protein CcaverHIS002_0411760 [Cutaneotrichosporon cavernicola]BEJ00119.1 hypothetical protein CcaverHIS631_0411610 [Cutaneotrichosporon cavernicola]BEJ07890.1 hypothetical protein CcaverHIS641_0411590 [Cutaneotrichosporon cavernicola]